ncbi:OmpA family protein [Sphaerothrix gracilis]|uniref:OmpA family protein n=1 Tax=Sphaerothrix gracilis TaxID=3151835 RepID=UPI0031FBCE14
MTDEGKPETFSHEPVAANRSWLRSLLIFLFRLLLLGVSSTLAWLVGILIAQFYSAPVTANPPLLESLSRRSSRTAQKLQQLPQWWQQGNTASQVIVPAVSPAPSATNPTSPPAAPQLTPAERQTLETELAALENELEQLSDRAADLEAQVDRSRAGGSLEDRLAAIAAAITPVPEPTASETADPSLALLEPPPVATAPPASDFPKITLPGSVLFADNSSQLRPEAESWLEALLPDLSAYPRATVLIGVHTQPQPEAASSRQLSFLQASAVRRYLSAQLGESYRWLPVGYGQTQPVPGDRAAQNHRLELVIIPAD